MDSPNVSPIPRQGDLGTFQKWEADKLLIRYGAGVPDVYFQEIDLPFRQVIPEPSTSAFAAIGLAAIILSQYKRSR